MTMLFPTTLVGSYPQPEWLIDRQKLASRFPPRVRARELWRVPEPWLAEAQNDATRMAIHDQEAVGLDIVTDGEIRRESYSNRIATALEGIDVDNPGTALDRSGHPNPVPRIVGAIRRRRPVEVEDVRFLRAHTTGTTAVHICFGYAAIIHRRPTGYSFLPELAGCPCRQVSVESAQSKLDRAVLGKLEGKQIMVGCLDLDDRMVETAEAVAAHIKRALTFVKPENVILAPDCGMKYLPRDVAFGKLTSMVAAAKMLRAELGARQEQKR